MKLNIQKILQKSQLSLKRTKITATIGPASNKKEVLVQHLKNGLNICRINFSHDDHQIQLDKLNKIRDVLQQSELYKHTAIMLDTKGPEIRTSMLKDHKKLALKQGQQLIVGTKHLEEGDENKIHVSYDQLLNSVEIGSRILVADGNLTLKVLEKDTNNNEVLTEVQNNFLLGEKKNVNIPGANIEIPTITEKDKNDIVNFGVKHNVDYIALSFARTANCIKECRELLGDSNIGIIPKIENQQGLFNLDEILPLSDGMMLARGDLGMELYPEQMFAAQKYSAYKCQEYKKPMIVATQMMESMVDNSRPTRAEITDVGNAVLELNDGVMLSGETGNGKFPVESLLTQSKICKETESNIDYEELFRQKQFKAQNSTESLAYSAVTTSFSTDSQIIVCLSGDLELIKVISYLKPNAYILYPSSNEQLLRQSQLYYGVIPVEVNTKNTNEILNECRQVMKDLNINDICESMVVVNRDQDCDTLKIQKIVE